MEKDFTDCTQSATFPSTYSVTKYCTSLPCHGAPTEQSITMPYFIHIVLIRYNEEADLYCFEQPSVPSII
eukprot:15361269-Ditylum_brightwellii.AAC.2